MAVTADSVPPGAANDASSGADVVAPPGAVDPRVARAVAGDRQAASEIAGELLPRVRNLVRYLSRGDQEVDDIAQQALVEVLRALRGFRGEGTLHAFSDRITARVCLAHLKRRRQDAARATAHAADLWPIDSDGGSPDAYFRRREVARILDGLPDDQREVLVLHHVLGYSVPELARELAIPFETARSRLRLGIQKLRAALESRSER